MKEYISNCCGAKLYHPDIAMCKDCGEHCDVEEIVENLNHPYGGLEDKYIKLNGSIGCVVEYTSESLPHEPVMTTKTMQDRFNKEFVDEDTGLLNIGKYDHERLINFIKNETT